MTDKEIMFITTTDNDFENFKKDLHFCFDDIKEEHTKEKDFAEDYFRGDLILRDTGGRRIRSPSPSPERRIFLKR